MIDISAMQTLIHEQEKLIESLRNEIRLKERAIDRLDNTITDMYGLFSDTIKKIGT